MCLKYEDKKRIKKESVSNHTLLLVLGVDMYFFLTTDFESFLMLASRNTNYDYISWLDANSQLIYRSRAVIIIYIYCRTHSFFYCPNMLTKYIVQLY